MSSNAFVAPPALELAPSRVLVAWLVGSHLLAAGVAFTLPFPLLVQLSIGLALAVSAVYGLRVHAWLSAPIAVTGVRWIGDGRWALVQRDGSVFDAELQPGSYVHPALLVLNFRLATGGRRSVVVCAGRADADAVRRWRAALAERRSAVG